jgi:hypothetical protein
MVVTGGQQFWLWQRRAELVWVFKIKIHPSEIALCKI